MAKTRLIGEVSEEREARIAAANLAAMSDEDLESALQTEQSNIEQAAQQSEQAATKLYAAQAKQQRLRHEALARLERRVLQS